MKMKYRFICICGFGLSIAAWSQQSAPPQAESSDNGADRSLASLESDIEAGKEVSIPIKFRNYQPHDSQYAAIYCFAGPECGDPQSVAANLYDAVVRLSKTTFTLSGGCRIMRGFRGPEDCDFQVPPSKIIGLENQPERASRLHVQVAIKNNKGDKEERKDYYFYNAGAIAAGAQAPGGEGTSFVCSGCDDSMNVLYALLTNFRGGQWVPIQDAPAAPPAPAPDSAQGGGLAAVSGQYAPISGNGASLVLLPDGSLTLFVPNKGQGSGHFSVTGDTADLTVSFEGRTDTVKFKIQGDGLVAGNGITQWVRQGDVPVTPPPQRQFEDIAPPPPPADAPPPAPPTIALGQTMDQATAAFGQPLKVAKVGAKTIFYYKDMKVTFTNGKVSNVE